MDGQRSQNVLFHGHSILLKGFTDDTWTALSSYRRFIDIAVGYSHFIVIGADILDGHYGALDIIQRMRFLNLAAKMGIETVITGCSFNGTSDLRIRNLFIEAENAGTIIYARDNVSLVRLSEFLQKVRGVADLAFLVDTEKYPLSPRIDEIRKRATMWKDHGGVVVGINLCGWHIKDRTRFFDEFIEALIRLDTSYGKLGLILLPHDTRTHALSDLDTLSEFHRRLGNRIEVIGTPQDIESGIDAKQAVRCCDALLTGRMHLAIAAHDQGVPAVSFAYQGKFEGFYALYGMGTEWMVDYENVDGAVRALQMALEQRYNLSANILEHKNKNQFLANLNFECIR